MPDRDDRLLDLDDDVDAYEDDWEPAPEERALPPRPRRRLITPASVALAAVLIAAVGFIGGVEVQEAVVAVGHLSLRFGIGHSNLRASIGRMAAARAAG